LVDLALPNNKIPRVYANTGIEYQMIVDFVKQLAKTDDRIKIIKPTMNIKKVLETYGYPFKSKGHSYMVDVYQRNGLLKGIKNYLGEGEKTHFRPCPNILKYQFTETFKLRVSDKCCEMMKERPLIQWQKDNGKTYSIIGIMREEGGRREQAQCLVFNGGVLKHFQPLAPVTKEWEDWFIERQGIKLCDLYYPPYNFKRTGCKGCPFSLNLQHDLETMQKHFPNERKQCEIIWQPVYAEYRRLGYRLEKEEQLKLF
jgi:3'-phosphoadenosine 5'-phosphosulfate sulfotransferase (PAPS reductase)/FAD synthetase